MILKISKRNLGQVHLAQIIAGKITGPESHLGAACIMVLRIRGCCTSVLNMAWHLSF